MGKFCIFSASGPPNLSRATARIVCAFACDVCAMTLRTLLCLLIVQGISPFHIFFRMIKSHQANAMPGSRQACDLRCCSKTINISPLREEEDGAAKCRTFNSPDREVGVSRTHKPVSLP